jgi:hypothetical protein
MYTSNHARYCLCAGHAIVVVLVALSCTLVTRAAEACFHVGSSVEVGQSEQQAVIFHRDGRQDLVMRIGLETSGPIESLGWILPVPSLPDDYEVYDDEIFADLEEAVGLREKKQRGLTVGPASAGAKMAVKEHPSASAGPYRIQPIEVDPERGVAPLQDWMVDNNFEPLGPAQLQYYVQRGWVFLAIRVDPQEGKEHLEGGGRLPALRASFASEHAVYPLKMSTHQGVFPVRLYLITDERPDDEAFMGASLRGFHVAKVRGKKETGKLNYEMDTILEAGVPSIELLMSQKLTADPLIHEYSVRLGELNREQAPASVARFLTEVDAWQRRDNYALSVLYNPHANQGAGRAARWPEELAIPALALRDSPEGGGDAPAPNKPGPVATDTPPSENDNAADTTDRTEGVGCASSPAPSSPRPLLVPTMCVLIGLAARITR